MMPELHPGDMVYIRDSLKYAQDCASGLINSMKKRAGEWVTISKKWGEHCGQHCYYIHEDGGCAVWSEDCFDFDISFPEENIAPDVSSLL